MSSKFYLDLRNTPCFISYGASSGSSALPSRHGLLIRIPDRGSNFAALRVTDAYSDSNSHLETTESYYPARFSSRGEAASAHKHADSSPFTSCSAV